MAVPGALADPSAVAGEEVTFPGFEGTAVRGYLARPTAGETPHGAVIVLHEAMGLNDHIKDVVRRVAGLGYTALGPDLYTREGIPAADDREAIFATMLSQADAQVVGDLQGAADYLHGLSEVNGRVACVGFCSGGRQTLLFAANTTSLAAAADCWGGFTRRASAEEETTPRRPVPPIDQLEGLQCPLLVVVGGKDQNPSPDDGRAIVARAAELGKDARLSVYEDAGHAFFADYRPTYVEPAAHRLWDELQEFWAKHLR
ncbi:MAG: dienelactone hydrolase family protein [Solirubrobacteraceae bacterium]